MFSQRVNTALPSHPSTPPPKLCSPECQQILLQIGLKFYQLGQETGNRCYFFHLLLSRILSVKPCTVQIQLYLSRVEWERLYCSFVNYCNVLFILCSDRLRSCIDLMVK